MQKMTVMALPKNVIDVMAGQCPLEKPVDSSLRGVLQKIYALRGDAFFFSIAFLLGRLVFLGDLAPFGIGFFAVVAQKNRDKVVGTGLAILCGVASTGRYAEIAVYLLAMLVCTKLAKRFTKLDKQMLAVPFSLFFTVLIGASILNYLQTSMLYLYMVAAFNAMLCVVSAQLFRYGVPVLMGRAAWLKAYQQKENECLICAIVILALAVAGIGEVQVYGWSIQSICAGILVMTLALVGGAGLGAALGVALGLSVGLSGSGAAMQNIALYAAGGAIAGLFQSLGKFAVILGFVLGSLILHFSFTQLPLLMRSVTETVLAAGLVMFIPGGLFRDFTKKNISCESADKLQQRLVENNDKLQQVSNLLYEVSSVAGMCKPPQQPSGELIVAKLFSAVGLKVCENCPNRSGCWEENYYRTYQLLLNVFQHLDDKPLQGKQLPLEFREECQQAGRLVEVVNDVVERDRINLYWQDKVYEQKRLIGDQIKAVGNVVNQLAQEIDRTPAFNYALAKSLYSKTANINCPIENIKIVGKEDVRRIEFQKVACGKNSECVNSLLPLISGVVKQPLSLTRQCGNVNLNAKCKICLRTTPVLKVNTAVACIGKASNNICGDSVKVVQLIDGKVSIMLSDGMGSGTKAAKESQLTVECLSKLLKQGFAVAAAVKMVNSLLLLQSSGERFATVDMAIVDQYTGNTEFLKIAAAPSFIKRVREVKEVKAKALPVGILNQIEIEPICVKLVEQDVLIMVSDGIADLKDIKLHSSDKEGWLINFIRRMDIDNEQKFAEAIIQEALRLSNGEVKDDMSVLVMRLEKNNEL